MRIQVRANLSSLEAKIRKIKSNKMQTALREIGEQEVADAQHRIAASKTGPDGVKWRPWAYSTLRQAMKKGGRSLLYNTGFLFRSFVISVKKNSLKISNSASYAWFLQYGTRFMPARPFIGINKDRLKNKIRDLFK